MERVINVKTKENCLSMEGGAHPRVYSVSLVYDLDRGHVTLRYENEISRSRLSIRTDKHTDCRRD